LGTGLTAGELSTNALGVRLAFGSSELRRRNGPP